MIGPGRRFVRLPTTHNPEQSGRRFAATIHNPLPLRGNNPQPIFFLAASRLAAANLEVPNNQNPSSTLVKKTNNFMQPATLSRRRGRRRRALSRGGDNFETTCKFTALQTTHVRPAPEAK